MGFLSMDDLAMDEELHHGVTISQGPSLLEALPTEIILKAMAFMSTQDLTNLVLLNKRFYQIFKQNQSMLMAEVLLNQPELHVLMLGFCADASNLTPGLMLQPYSFDFFAGLESGKIITLYNPPVDGDEAKHGQVETVTFSLDDINQLWNWVRVVDWWVEKYPSIRWRDSPEDCRCLMPEEERRLRLAVARWWLYSTYFHGPFWRDRLVPLKWRKDHRLHHIRILETSEIRELDGLMGLVWETISKDLCSSPGRFTSNGRCEFEMIPWGSEEGRHNDIVNTYMKLDPWQLKFFLVEMAGRKKKDIIAMASKVKRNFTMDRETLSLAIKVVLQERLMLQPPYVTDVPGFGIVDVDRPTDKDAAAWVNDSSPNGEPAISQTSIDAFPRESNREVWLGDDGSDSGWPY